MWKYSTCDCADYKMIYGICIIIRITFCFRLDFRTQQHCRRHCILQTGIKLGITLLWNLVRGVRHDKISTIQPTMNTQHLLLVNLTQSDKIWEFLHDFLWKKNAFYSIWPLIRVHTDHMWRVTIKREVLWTVSPVNI